MKAKNRPQLAKDSRKAFWFELIRKWKTSGQTKSTFCKEQGISVASFYVWLRRLKQSSSGGDVANENENLFTPIQIISPSSNFPQTENKGMLIRLPNGIEIQQAFPKALDSWQALVQKLGEIN